MNNKGFTLVELLGVIIILTVIFLLYPSVDNILEQSEEITEQKQINTILNATYDWSLKNASYLPNEGENTYVTLNELKLNGLIDGNLINPKTEEPFSNDLVISITSVDNDYTNNNKYSKKSGKFLYSILIDRLSNSSYEANKPSIVLSGITPDSEGNYVTQVNLNDELSKVTYTATDSNGNDLTDKVVVTVTCNNKIVSNVSSKKAGIYYINYTVVDNLGYATNVVRSVIVIDNEAPVLIFPNDNSISTTVTSYDLNEGVSCTDNSGVCKITYTGSIVFKTAGKNIIEYKAVDPSGNTVTQKRVITVE